MACARPLTIVAAGKGAIAVATLVRNPASVRAESPNARRICVHTGAIDVELAKGAGLDCLMCFAPQVADTAANLLKRNIVQLEELQT